jgi:hypothetical protein
VGGDTLAVTATWRSRSVVLVVLVVVLVLGSCTNGADSRTAADSGSGSAADRACVDSGEPFEGETQLFIENNATDQDTGVHGVIGSDGVSNLCIRTPDGTEMLLVAPEHTFGELGISDFLFESREPPIDEYPISELEKDFPEGEYRISGTGADGTPRVGTALFTHDIPAAPGIEAPPLAEEENASDVTLPTSGLVVRWAPVTETIAGAPLTVSAYEVIVTEVEHEDPNGQSRPAYDVTIPSDRTELAVADGFLRPGTVYEVEVLVVEESGNRTISAGFFTTAS